jgi:hypothetical protein
MAGGVILKPKKKFNPKLARIDERICQTRGEAFMQGCKKISDGIIGTITFVVAVPILILGMPALWIMCNHHDPNWD